MQLPKNTLQGPSKDGKLKEVVQHDNKKKEEWVEVTSSKKNSSSKNKKNQEKESDNTHTLKAQGTRHNAVNFTKT